ncbi:MAG: 5-(carboxyamino)imidazole ribonucleotide synthase [Myxococcota bacterium]
MPNESPIEDTGSASIEECLPGATIGIIGGGQLARMMILEARRMGLRVAVLAPQNESATPLADHWVQGALDDRDAAMKLAEISDVITLDTEHVPATLLAEVEATCPVRPGSSVLRTIQDRQTQREFLGSIGAPQPRTAPVDSVATLEAGVEAIGLPCVLKTRRAGYDGKGQTLIREQGDLALAWDQVGQQPAVLEEFVDFDFEVSVLLARRPSGEMAFYPMAHNRHRNHILNITMAPAPVSPELEAQAVEVAGQIATALDHVGMMAVEMFVVEGSRLLVNEIAPRPHNSGHYTFGACATSQFEQHVRAVANLPLGDPTLMRPAATVNLLGDLWQNGEPDWHAVLAHPKARLHLYGKLEPRAGRKMGHVLVVDDEPDRAAHVSESLLDELEVGASEAT